MKRKIVISLLGVLVLFILITGVYASEDFEKAEQIIKNKISCSELSDDQLELIGDYYMEQMHPGTAHEYMDNMMGGEGSESLREVHINIAKSFYCGNSEALSPGMMNFLVGRGNYSYGMMQGKNYGMMGNYYPYRNYYEYNIFIWLSAGIIILLIILIIVILQRNKSRSENGKRKIK